MGFTQMIPFLKYATAINGISSLLFKDGNLTTVREQINCEKQDNQTTKFEYVGIKKAKVTHYNGFYVNNYQNGRSSST